MFIDNLITFTDQLMMMLNQMKMKLEINFEFYFKFGIFDIHVHKISHKKAYFPICSPILYWICNKFLSISGKRPRYIAIFL